MQRANPCYACGVSSSDKSSEQLDPAAERERLTQIAAAYAPTTESVTEQEANAFAARQGVDEVVGPDVLVLGAATGVWAKPLLERFEHFDSVDAVPELIEAQTQEYGERVRGFVALFEEFEPERRYDTVVMGHVLEHVQDSVALLRRAKSWCKPGGRLLILVPNAESIHRLSGVELGYLESPTSFTPGDVTLGHRRVYSQESLRADVEAAGLRCSKMDGILLKPLSNAQMDSWDADLRAAFFSLGQKLPSFACVLACVAE